MTHHKTALYDCACSYLENFQLYGFEFPKASLVFHLCYRLATPSKIKVTLVLDGVTLSMVKIDLISFLNR